MALNIGNMVGMALRLVTHRAEIEQLFPKIAASNRAIQELMQTWNQAYALAAKIAPELLPSSGRAATITTTPYDARWLQQSLNTLINANLVVDGIIGPLTQAAVREFQQQHGLTVDGWAGVATEAKIIELLALQK